MSIPRLLIARRNFIIASALAGGGVGTILQVTPAHAAGGKFAPLQKLDGGNVKDLKGEIQLHATEIEKVVALFALVFQLPPSDAFQNCALTNPLQGTGLKNWTANQVNQKSQSFTEGNNILEGLAFAKIRNTVTGVIRIIKWHTDDQGGPVSLKP